jgi:hypothetical protein
MSLMDQTVGRVHWFRKKKFSLQSETRSVSHAHVKMFFFSLHFASNFSLPTKAKLIERIFALFRFQNFFASFRFRSFRFASMRNEINVFSLCFRLISYSFPFRCENKRKKTLFRIEAKKFCFHFASKRKLWHFFASVLLHFASKRK